ncbi:MAG: hypothetical protein JW700_01190 [Candidatus Aenigmarchaeota archaeon]|nr:hypothetical protein [Candidatus Aenigmarchaeota archaeon]
MVWARSKLMIHDDLLRPVPKMKMSFKGVDSRKFYKEIYNLLLANFRVHEHSVQEKEFSWSKGKTEKFKIKWELNKDLDKFSFYWVEVSLEGEASGSSGSAQISVEGALRTEYPQDTKWQKSLLYEFLRMLWHSSFYSSKRDEYLREGRYLLSSFVNEIRVLSSVQNG